MFDQVARRVGVLSAIGLLLMTGARVRAADAAQAGSFVQQVDVSRFRLVAVQHDGRFKSIDTMARETLKRVMGTASFKRTVDGKTVKQDPVFTYLDMTLNPEAYREQGVLFVKKLPVRQQLILAAGSSITDEEAARIRRTGLVSIGFLQNRGVKAKLMEMRGDVNRGAKDVDALLAAMSLSSVDSLLQSLRIIPPPGSTNRLARWHSIDAVNADAHAGHNHAMETEPIPNLAPADQQRISQLWSELAGAWQASDAATVNAKLDALAAEFPKLAPAIYPALSKLSLEHWYYKYYKMTWTWVFYLIAFIFLLMGIVYQWPRARRIGFGVFGFAFILHTIASGIRWYLAGRIPNSNMFEAVTAAAWFGALMAMFFEAGPSLTRRAGAWRAAWAMLIGGTVVFVGGLFARGVSFHAFQEWGPIPTTGLIVLSTGTMMLVSMAAARRLPSKGLTILGASVAAMIALMAGYFMDVTLNSDIENRMPVLNDVWLYIHTNMIIASYALIGIAYVTSAMYVIGRLLTRPTTALWLWMVIPTAIVPMYALGIWARLGREAAVDSFIMLISAWIPFAIVVVGWMLAALFRFIWRDAAGRAFQVWEGSLLMPAMVQGSRRPAGGPPPDAELPAIQESNPLLEDPKARKGGLASVLDGATMLLFELFFIILWTGIIMGAIWADHSWGRPWGWDPKEVFALNTWIIFLILVHVRIKVQDKPLWTAVLGVWGCSVMLFNWIVVNFFITGLHSYA